MFNFRCTVLPHIGMTQMNRAGVGSRIFIQFNIVRSPEKDYKTTFQQTVSGM